MTHAHPISVVRVPGVSGLQAERAIRWLKRRSLLAFYDVEERSLKAYEFRHGRDWTHAALCRALDMQGCGR